MNTEHTPGPWRCYPMHDGRVVIGPGYDGEPESCEQDVAMVAEPEDAALIVKAVNSHADMLAALEWALCHVRFSGGPEGDAETFSANYNAAQSAIAQAEGEK